MLWLRTLGRRLVGGYHEDPHLLSRDNCTSFAPERQRRQRQKYFQMIDIGFIFAAGWVGTWCGLAPRRAAVSASFCALATALKSLTTPLHPVPLPRQPAASICTCLLYLPPASAFLYLPSLPALHPPFALILESCRLYLPSVPAICTCRLCLPSVPAICTCRLCLTLVPAICT